MVFDVEYVNAHLADMEWERLLSDPRSDALLEEMALEASDGWEAGANFTDHMVFSPDTPAVIYCNENVLPCATAETFERLSASVQDYAVSLHALAVSLQPLGEVMLQAIATFVHDAQRINSVTHDDQNLTTV